MYLRGSFSLYPSCPMPGLILSDVNIHFWSTLLLGHWPQKVESLSSCPTFQSCPTCLNCPTFLNCSTFLSCPTFLNCPTFLSCPTFLGCPTFLSCPTFLGCPTFLSCPTFFSCPTCQGKRHKIYTDALLRWEKIGENMGDFAPTMILLRWQWGIVRWGEIGEIGGITSSYQLADLQRLARAPPRSIH